MSNVEKPIQLGGKYRLRGFPKSRVILLCTDGPHKLMPVAAWCDKLGDGDWYLLMFTKVGQFNPAQDIETKFYFDLIEAGEWDDFVDNEPVMVRDNERHDWERRHFKCVDDKGQPLTYPHGTSKWSSPSFNGGSPPKPWKFCRRPTHEEIAS